MLNYLLKAKVFIKLNLYNAYYKLYIKEEDKQKTTFKTRYSYFKYLVILFSLVNIPITFQSYIYYALKGLVDYTYVIYLDNILIYSKNKENYIVYIKEVLNRLINQGLYYKVSKYTFNTKLVEFLGYIITLERVIIDLVRAKTIRDQLEPK